MYYLVKSAKYLPAMADPVGKIKMFNIYDVMSTAHQRTSWCSKRCSAGLRRAQPRAHKRNKSIQSDVLFADVLIFRQPIMRSCLTARL